MDDYCCINVVIAIYSYTPSFPPLLYLQAPGDRCGDCHLHHCGHVFCAG